MALCTHAVDDLIFLLDGYRTVDVEHSDDQILVSSSGPGGFLVNHGEGSGFGAEREGCEFLMRKKQGVDSGCWYLTKGRNKVWMVEG